jgi:23S rRNA pseudouridine2605 synthase
MEELIIAGRITVNRMPAEIGQKVGPGDEVRINGEPVKIRFAEPKPRVLLYHKPTGELVTRDDPEDRPTVFDDLPSIRDGKWIAVGRLDYNTEGLLMFTNSGELANRLMHPRYEVEREYAVRVMGRLDDEQRQALVTGIDLDDGPAKVEKLEEGGGDDDSANRWYTVAIKEGRNREVRRLFEALGLTVSRLLRTRYGRVAMPSSLKRGEVLEMEPQEVNALLKSVGLKPAAGGQPQPGAAPREANGQRAPGGGSPRQGQRGRRRGGRGPNAGTPGNTMRQEGGPSANVRRADGIEPGNSIRHDGPPESGQGRRNAHGAPRTGPGSGKRHGQRKGAQAAPGKGKQNRRQGRGGNVAVGTPGNSMAAPPQHRAGNNNKAKRRRGPGKSSQHTQPGVVRDTRVGLLPPGADGRPPHMPVVTHKKRRTLVAEGGEPWSGPPREDDNS